MTAVANFIVFSSCLSFLLFTYLRGVVVAVLASMVLVASFIPYNFEHNIYRLSLGFGVFIAIFPIFGVLAATYYVFKSSNIRSDLYKSTFRAYEAASICFQGSGERK